MTATSSREEKSPQSNKLQFPADRCSTSEREFARGMLHQSSVAGRDEEGRRVLKREWKGVPGEVFTVDSRRLFVDAQTQPSSRTGTSAPVQGGVLEPQIGSDFRLRQRDEDESSFWEAPLANPVHLVRQNTTFSSDHGPAAKNTDAAQVSSHAYANLGGPFVQRHPILLPADQQPTGATSVRDVGVVREEAAVRKISRGTSAVSRTFLLDSEDRNSANTPTMKPREHSTAAKLAAEFCGCVCLVFMSSLAALGSDETAVRLHAGLATGFTIFVLVASIGQISGGQFNPAVSWAVALAGKMPFPLALAYSAAQLLGGCFGALLVRAVTKPEQYDAIAGGATIPPHGQFWAQATLSEAITTALLVQTILNAAVETPKNPLAPLAIGCTILVDIVGTGPLSGASMNPARSLGPCIAASLLSNQSAAHIWAQHSVYWAGPFTGATLSSLAYRFVFTNGH